MRLWLARHARVLAEEGLCYGSLDLPADPDQTLTAARGLATVLPAGVQVLSSPLRRCMQLAGAVTSLRPDLPARSEPRLAEMNFGSWEGRSWNALERGELDAWTADFAQYRVGGSGECASGFVARVESLLQETRSAGRDQAWITHAGVFKAVLLCRGSASLEAASDWPAQGLDCGAWHLFDIGT